MHDWDCAACNQATFMGLLGDEAAVCSSSAAAAGRRQRGGSVQRLCRGSRQAVAVAAAAAVAVG